MKRKISLILVILCNIFALINAQETKLEKKNENLLSQLPSKAEGEHIAKIKALGDNSWVNLGQAAADPLWGNEGIARGRAFSPKMASAPDLGGAFFCGTGVHGFIKPDGHYMDDLWFYDAYAHKWLCLYPGANVKTLKLHLDKNGLEINEQGDHIPVSYLSHAYYNTTYNTDLRLYHIMWTQCPWWKIPQRWEWLDQKDPGVAKRTYGAVGPIIASPKNPLLWDVAQGKWDRKLAEGPGPSSGRFEGVAEYIPSLKKSVYIYFGNTWFYDYATNTWSAGARVMPKSVAGKYALTGCYDAKRDCLYVGYDKEGLGCLDIKTGIWREIKGEGQPVSVGSGNSSHFNFDSVNGVLLLHHRFGSVYIYDPDSNKWSEESTSSGYAEIPGIKNKVSHGFYNAELNVHYFYMAGDSDNKNGTFFAYRYKNLKK